MSHLKVILTWFGDLKVILTWFCDLEAQPADLWGGTPSANKHTSPGEVILPTQKSDTSMNIRKGVTREGGRERVCEREREEE